MYMLRGYHSLENAGTLYTPQWIKMPNYAFWYHPGTRYCDRDSQVS